MRYDDIKQFVDTMAVITRMVFSNDSKWLRISLENLGGLKSGQFFYILEQI